MPNINHIKYELEAPQNLENGDWRQIHDLVFDTFAETTLSTHSEADIEYLARYNDHERFIRSHTDPQSEVGKSRRNGQDIYDPSVVVAKIGTQVVGFAAAEQNVSGTTIDERRLKAKLLVARYFHMREIYVDPTCQRYGIAIEMARRLLQRSHPLQPVSTHIWPEAIPFLEPVLTRHGFHRRGEPDHQKVFGEHMPAVEVVMMRHPLAARLSYDLWRAADGYERRRH